MQGTVLLCCGAGTEPLNLANWYSDGECELTIILYHKALLSIQSVT